MIGQRHRVPTHLNLEDKAVLGLTLRELACVGLGALVGFTAYGQLAMAPLPLRLLAALACLAVGAGVAFIRPLGRGLEEWCFVLLHYLATPRHALWHPRALDPAEWSGRVDDWAAAAVRITGARPSRAGASPRRLPVLRDGGHDAAEGVN
jgi:hypothetical protein